jgi:hypothetical protein
MTNLLRRAARAAFPIPDVRVIVSRDDVHAGDDNRQQEMTFPARTPLVEVIDSVYLPNIHGGDATWVAYSTGTDGNIRMGTLLGVVAQQWTEPVLFVSQETLLDLARRQVADGRVHLDFRYHCQVDPALVIEDICSGKRPRGR